MFEKNRVYSMIFHAIGIWSFNYSIAKSSSSFVLQGTPPHLIPTGWASADAEVDDPVPTQGCIKRRTNKRLERLGKMKQRVSREENKQEDEKFFFWGAIRPSNHPIVLQQVAPDLFAVSNFEARGGSPVPCQAWFYKFKCAAAAPRALPSILYLWSTRRAVPGLGLFASVCSVRDRSCRDT